MDNLIQDLRDLAEWAEGQEWEVPLGLYDALKEAADELEKRRWIPVEERLPENHELVIWWLVPSIGQKYGFAFPSTFDEKKGMPEAATHWMALTEGPREESNGNQH